MEEFTATLIFSITFSIIVTWTIGLIPPLLIRYVFLRRPMAKKPAIGIAALFWFLNIMIFMAMGSESKTHAVLLLIAYVSYRILRREKKRSEGFSTPFSVNSDKIELIKNLVKKRVQNDPIASTLGDIDSLSETMLMGLPEATIMTIVETYCMMKRQGNLPDEEIFEAIEAHRSMLGDTGTIPSPLTLSSYIKYRLGLEHSHGAPLRSKFVDKAIEEAKRFFLFIALKFGNWRSNPFQTNPPLKSLLDSLRVVDRAGRNDDYPCPYFEPLARKT